MKSLPPQKLYTPFDTGQYSFHVGLETLSQDAQIFSIDDQLPRYRDNKEAIRKSNPGDHIGTKEISAELHESVTRWLVGRTVDEHPEHFSPDTATSFEEIALQLQEDLAIIHVPEKGEDRLVAVHVCAPSGWDPSEKLGKSFLEIHEPIPEMQHINKNADNMMRALTRQGIRRRFVWGITFDDALNRHPKVITHENRTHFNPDAPEVYVRVERQCIIGFPEQSAFVFTIRTYMYDVLELSREHRKNLRDALLSLSPAIREYKGITDDVQPVVSWLSVGL
ncbi:MAG: heme-dependent oxidative N-demethylase subunit alpha family protein [Candidatus Hydrogenedentota bacterium]